MTISHTAQHTSTQAVLVSITADVMITHNIPAQKAMSWALDSARSNDELEALYCRAKHTTLRMMFAAAKRQARGEWYSPRKPAQCLRASTRMYRCCDSFNCSCVN